MNPVANYVKTGHAVSAGPSTLPTRLDRPPYRRGVKTENGQIIHLIGDRQSFRCRQRGILSNGKKNSLKFVSFKEMQKEVTKDRCGKVHGPYVFDTISRL